MASIRKRKGRYEVRYWGNDGRQYSKTFRTSEEAKAFRSEVEVELNRGRWRPPTKRDQKVSYREFSRRHLTEASARKRITTSTRDHQVNETHLVPAFGDSPVNAITPNQVRNLISTLSQRGLAPKTVRTIIGVLRTIMSSALEEELILKNPCVGLRSLPPDARRPIRFLDVAELYRLAEAMGPTYRAAVFVLGVMGLRWSEVVGLRVGDIDFLQRTIRVDGSIAEVSGHLVRQSVKTAASRATLSAPQVVLDELARHLAATPGKAGDDLAFTAPQGGPLRGTNFRNRVWAPSVRRAGLPGLTIHGLRHSAAGLLIQLQAHPKLVQQRMRHASIRTTLDVYGHVLPAMDQAVVRDLDALLQSPPPDPPPEECGIPVGQNQEVS